MFPAQEPHQPPAPGSDLRQAAAKGFLYAHSRLSTNPTKTLEALSLDRRNDQRVWPDFPDHMVNPAVNRPDWPQCVIPEAGKELAS